MKIKPADFVFLAIAFVVGCATAKIEPQSPTNGVRAPFDTAVVVSGPRITSASGFDTASRSHPLTASTNEPRVMGSGKVTAKSRPQSVARNARPPNPAKVVNDQASASATIGAPNSESEKNDGAEAFQEGSAYMGSHQWSKAEERFRQAISFDGSIARYHAALGKVMMVQHKWIDAQAAYSAAVLLDLDNREYQKQLKIARSK